jgi:AcrR family transcriptional regulator
MQRPVPFVKTLARFLTVVHNWTVVFEETRPAPVRDRRVRRSRAALMRAAVDLVNERGTAAVSVTDIAETADVSRQVLYQQFGDRDRLLLEAALELVRTELVPNMEDPSGQAGVDRPRLLTAARHFAEHRVFYRALLMSSSSFALTRGLQKFFLPYYRRIFQHELGGRLDTRAIEDVAMFVTGGTGALTNTWMVEGEDPLDPEQFTDQLAQVVAVLTPNEDRPSS